MGNYPFFRLFILDLAELLTGHRESGDFFLCAMDELPMTGGRAQPLLSTQSVVQFSVVFLPSRGRPPVVGMLFQPPMREEQKQLHHHRYFHHHHCHNHNNKNNNHTSPKFVVGPTDVGVSVNTE